MVLLLITSVCSPGSFYLLMPVVPLYVATAGVGGLGAGMSTGALMLGTVLMEFAVPALLHRYGYRLVMAAGLLLLGAPALVLLASSSLPLVLGVCLVRGAGLGIIVVAGAALVAELVPPDRRGEGLGLYGAAAGVPSIACLPLGLWLVGNVGYGPVFITGAAMSLLTLAVVPGLPARSARIERGSVLGLPSRSARIERGSVLGALRIRGLARPTLIFATVTLAAGALLTFLPMAVPAESHHVAAGALLVQSCAAPLARWAAGWYGDRHGTAHLLVAAVLAATVGTAVLVWVGSPVAVIAGMGLFGLGFGLAQNVTLALMFARAPESDFARVSALWNLAYDGGMGVGAIVFGLLTVPMGYPVAFAVTAIVLFTALAPAWLDHGAASKG
ncbi:MFS transporter [Acrocarpospora phusangensis]|nr:MFS transporter [Acrocarpospora phusangensis]